VKTCLLTEVCLASFSLWRLPLKCCWNSWNYYQKSKHHWNENMCSFI